MSDSYDDYESKMQLAEHEWEMVKTEHNKKIEIAQAYERGWNAALAQREWLGLTDEEIEHIADSEWEEAFVRMIEAKLKEKNT